MNLVAPLTGNSAWSRRLTYDAHTDPVHNVSYPGLLARAEYGGSVSDNGTRYVMGDQQGTPRVVMTSAPAVGQIVASRHDYLPFGEEVGAGVGMRTTSQGYSRPDSLRQKYAGMEGDDSTGMSHTLWREYDNLSARWTAPDPYGGSMSLASPQTFNRYAYVNNDPVNKVDPTGLMLSDIGVVQTHDSGYAHDLELKSDADRQIAINREYAARHGMILIGEQIDGVTYYSAYVGQDNTEETSPNISEEGGITEPSPQDDVPACSSAVTLADPNTPEGALSRLIFEEGQPIPPFDSEDYWRGLNAVAASVQNRAAFLNQPGLKQSGTAGLGTVGASVTDVVYSRGLNPNGKSSIAIQFRGFTPDGISLGIQRRISRALNSPLGDSECEHLLNSVLVARTYHPAFDPFAAQGGTYAMRTAGASSPGRLFSFLGTIAGNDFYGLKR